VDDASIPPVATASIDPPKCGAADGQIDITVTPDTGNQFMWSNGMTIEDPVGLAPGEYLVTITGENGCTWTGSFTLPFYTIIAVNLQADLFSSGGDSLTITADVNISPGAIDTVIWNPAGLFYCPQDYCLKQTIVKPSNQTEIRVMVIDTNGCRGEARISLDDYSDPKVYIPNVFSPNQDGVNDFFTVYGNKDVELIVELRIFDRWGNMVFRNNEFPPNSGDLGWNGMFREKPMNPAVFAYWARVLFKDGSEGFYRGDVTLVR
jgi:gliding motility-associated-like protein